MSRLFICAFVVGITGCVANTVTAPFAQQLQLWPEEPGAARIALVGEFSSARDLGVTGSAWSRLIGMAAGRDGGALMRPMDVAVAEEGRKIYVADPAAACVHFFDLVGNRYQCLSPKSDDADVAPIGLAVTDRGHLFVADSARGTLWQAAAGSKHLKPLNLSVVLKQPTGLYWDEASQSLYVTDTKRHAIFVFDRAGNLKRSIGEGGKDRGQFNYPTYLWVDGNHELVVTDSLNFRLQRFLTSGDHLLTFGEGGDRPGDFSRPKGVATDSLGHVYVVDALMHAFQVFNRQGQLLLVIGRQGQGGAEFWLPNGIFISSDDTIYIADVYNKRVQVFRYIGATT